MNNTSTGENMYSWVSPKINLQDSAVAGIGYFANDHIKKDEKIIVQAGQCLHVSKVDNPAMESMWYHGFQIESDIYYYPFIVGEKPYLDGIFCINHSCEPNAGFKGQITLVAMKDIMPGDEITFDYAMTDVETTLESPWETQTCFCKTDMCRGNITGHDWKLNFLQDRYQGYFSSYVTNLIQATNSDDTL